MLVADFEDTRRSRSQPPGSGTTAVTSNVWHHAAATYDTATDTWRLYLDGDLDATLALAGNFTPESTSIQHAALGTAHELDRRRRPASSTAPSTRSASGTWLAAPAQIRASKDLELTSGPGLIARYGLIEGAGTTTASSVAGAPVGTSSTARSGRPVRRSRRRSTSRRSSAPTSPTSATPRVTRRQPRRRRHRRRGDTLTYTATGLPAGITIDAGHRRHQRHAVASPAPAPTASRSPVIRRQPDRHRHLHLDGHQHQPGAGLQHRHRRPDRGRGRHGGLDADATDADGDTLTYSATGLPAGRLDRPDQRRHQRHARLRQRGHLHRHRHRHRRHAERHRHLHLTVGATNQDPTFDQDLADRTDAEGALVSLDAAATDPDGDTLTYGATGLPAGLSIDSATGLISGTISLDAAAGSPTPSASPSATAPSVDATDTFTWTVTNTDQAPVFSTDIGDRTDAEGDTPISLDADATDPDGDTLTYSATGLPAGSPSTSHRRHQRHARRSASAGAHNVV